MKKIERANQLLRILSNKNGETIKALADALDVSEMTIRRDVYALSEKNLVTLIRGVAIYNHHKESFIQNKEYSIATEREVFSEEKSRIGKKAATIIEPNDVIIIDTGTTTEHLARYISHKNNLTVICYNMNILMEIKDKTNKIIFI